MSQFFELSPEKKKIIDEDRKKSIERYKKQKDFQIGELIAEILWLTKMPSLSTNPCHSRNITKVSKEDSEKLNILSDKWYKEQTKENWFDYQTFLQLLKDKYLPKECVFYYQFCCEINDEFKQGLIQGLMNTDGCEYSLDSNDIDITENECFITIKFIYKPRPIMEKKNNELIS